MTEIAPQWRYSAENSRGETVEGLVEAADLETARGRLGVLGLSPITVAPAPGRMKVTSARLSTAARARICGRLSDLLGAGVAIAPALRLAAEQSEDATERRFLSALFEKVRSGRSLSEAVALSGVETPRLFVVLIETGEALGSLDRQMERLARHFDETLKLRREIFSQLLYPAALTVLIFATLLFLSFVVLPEFQTIFANASSRPPPETRFVLGAGSTVRAYWYLFPAGAAAVYFSIRFLARRSPEALEQLRLRAPVAGRLLRLGEFGLFFRALSTLMLGGAPISRAMPLAQQSISLVALRNELTAVESALRVGERLAPALRRHSSCPCSLISFIEIGEESGELGRMAAAAAERAEADVRTAVRRAMMLLAPILTALMGVLTAGVIGAVMSGVLSLNDAIY